MKSGVSISSFRIKEKNKSNSFIPFYSKLSVYKDGCPYDCNNIEELLDVIYDNHIEPIVLENDYKMFSINNDSKCIKKNNNMIYYSFTVSCGSYGTKSAIKSIKTKKVNYYKDTEDADMKEYRVMFIFPNSATRLNIKKGLLLFQSIGTRGIKAVTCKVINQFLSTNFNLLLDIASVTSELELGELENYIKSITFIKNKVDNYYTNLFGIKTGKEITTISYINNKTGIINNLKKVIHKDDGLIEVKSEYDDIKLTIDINGRKKTISVDEIENVYFTHNLPEKSINVNGELDIDIIDKSMIEMADDSFKKIVSGEDNVEDN